MNVLIVESNLSVGSWFCDTILQWGHKPDHVPTGRKALKRITENAYGVVIVNTLLSDMRAADLIPLLKKRIPDAGVVVMTNHNNARIERSIRKLGITYYMTGLAPTKDLRSVLDHTPKINSK